MARHNLSNVNLDTATADCSICGPNIRIKIRGTGDNIRRHCRNKEIELSKARYQKEKDNQAKNRYQQKLKSMNALNEANIIKYNTATHCEICGVSKEELGESFNIDHCHETNQFRGVLCRPCNLGLGFFRDSVTSLLKAAEYLKERNNFN